MLQGRIKIIPFIRRDLWTIREDRKAIARAMKENEILEKELPADQKLAILNARSGFANSADDIFQFINEVTQAGKMREATKEAKALPKGNWVYTFSSFREVVDALRVCLNLKGNIRRKEATANVLDELRDNFKYLFEKRNGRVFSKLSWAAKVRSLFSGIWDESITVTMEELGSFAFFGFNLPVTIGTLKADRLRAAIASGVFLDFDRETESLVVGPLQRQLLEILGRIEALKNLLAGDDLKKLPEAITKLVQSRKTTFPNLILMHSMFAYDGIEDLQNRIFNVHKFLRGDSETLVIAAPIRTIPFFDETKRTANEKLDDTDVRKLLQQR
jgi:hypothetical protein